MFTQSDSLMIQKTCISLNSAMVIEVVNLEIAVCRGQECVRENFNSNPFL